MCLEVVELEQPRSADHRYHGCTDALHRGRRDPNDDHVAAALRNLRVVETELVEPAADDVDRAVEVVGRHRVPGRRNGLEPHEVDERLLPAVAATGERRRDNRGSGGAGYKRATHAAIVTRGPKLSLARGSAAALAAGGLFLGGRSALPRARAGRARRCLLPTATRGAGRVCDPRGALFRHPLLPQSFVLLLVLDACSFARHK